MNREDLPGERWTLTEVSTEFRNWRSSRKRGTKIPQHLWQAAARLSEQHSIGCRDRFIGWDQEQRKLKPITD